MGSRKIIKQVQVPAETTGNLYTLTDISPITMIKPSDTMKVEG